MNDFIGVVVALVAVGAFGYFLWRKLQAKKRPSSEPTGVGPAANPDAPARGRNDPPSNHPLP
jgi:hypothetical protein